MHVVAAADREFERRFRSGEWPVAGFDHRAHLRLAYVMLTHYSKDLLFGEAARREFVEPDLEPIPPGRPRDE